MKYFFILLLLSGSLITTAQKIIPVGDENKVFERVELSAHFPGGEVAWVRFVERNFDLTSVIAELPDSVREFKDSIYVQFIVTKQGLLINPETSACRTPALEKGVLALLKKSPAWEPEIQGSGPVKSYVSYLFTCWFVADYAGVSVRWAKFPSLK